MRGVVGVQRLRPARVDAVEVHLLGQQRQVVVGHRFAGRPVHHLLDEFGGERVEFWAAAIAIVDDHRQRFGAGSGLVVVGHEPLDLVEKDAGLLEVADEAGVAGDMHQ